MEYILHFYILLSSVIRFIVSALFIFDFLRDAGIKDGVHVQTLKLAGISVIISAAATIITVPIVQVYGLRVAIFIALALEIITFGTILSKIPEVNVIKAWKTSVAMNVVGRLFSQLLITGSLS